MHENAKNIKFEIVTPERVVLKEDVVQVTVPTRQGEITVLPDHIPLVAPLMPGVIEAVRTDGSREIMSLSGGFIEVLKNRVVILADTAERAEEIDMEKAEQARERAQAIMKETRRFDQAQFADISAKIAKELARTQAVKRWKKIRSSIK